MDEEIMAEEIVEKTISAVYAEQCGLLDIMDYSFKFYVNFICPKCFDFQLRRFRTDLPYVNEGIETLTCNKCGKGIINYDFYKWQETIRLNYKDIFDTIKEV